MWEGVIPRCTSQPLNQAKATAVISSGLFFKEYSSAWDLHPRNFLPNQQPTLTPRARDSGQTQPRSHPSPAHFGSRRMKLEGSTEAQHLDEIPLPPSLALAPRTVLAEGNPAGRGGGAGLRASSTGLPVPCRRQPGTRGRAGWWQRRKEGQCEAARGFYSPAFVARRRQWQDLFSFRHCCWRPRHFAEKWTRRRDRLIPNVVKGPRKSGTKLLERERKREGGGEGREERDVTTSRGRTATWRRRLGEPLPFQRLHVPGCRGPWAGRSGWGLARAWVPERGPCKRPFLASS